MQKNSIPALDVEQTLWAHGHTRVVGVDEVGRGCLSGPVFAAAVHIPVNCEMIEGVRDSKKLSPAQRERLYIAIKSQGLVFGIGAASVAEIDRINILNASYLAMQRALRRVRPYDHALIDGKDSKKFDLGPHTAIVGGDGSSYVIACASIIAKVTRDRLMRRLAKHYPGYGWERNAGYGTREHLQALEKSGVTPFHRRSYAPVRRILAGNGEKITSP
ncbi:MAG: ribonuclease HII [Gammaproteobacteria bacterium]|nr:ribonuclease HII [Gammaproteobacteria bacterium]